MSEDEWLACVHPQDRERAASNSNQAREDGSTFEHEFRVIWPDGQVRWLARRRRELLLWKNSMLLWD